MARGYFNHKGRPGLVGGSLPRNNLSFLFTILKGGKGSGNFGHAGRPGKKGGSGSGFTSAELSAVQDWSWLGSQTINARLEEGKLSADRILGGPSEQEVVDGLDSIIRKSPKTKSNQVLYSKFDAAPLFRQGNLKSGHEIKRKGFTSGTITPGGSRSSPSRRYDYEAVMEIHVPKGYKGVADISSLSRYPQEKEHLIKRGSTLRIREIKEGQEVYDPLRVIVDLIE